MRLWVESAALVKDHCWPLQENLICLCCFRFVTSDINRPGLPIEAIADAVNFCGELFRAEAPVHLISVDIEGVCTKLMSYLKNELRFCPIQAFISVEFQLDPMPALLDSFLNVHDKICCDCYR